MIISDFKFAQCISSSQKPDDDFGAQPDKNLVFASLSGIIDALESISQNIHVHNCGEHQEPSWPCQHRTERLTPPFPFTGPFSFLRSSWPQGRHRHLQTSLDPRRQ
ncbi:hypothetical protein P7K49_040748 [Saguinus oedipus]|uniref:Uncharacterized protein n=1 Tax=Saguinus oedipus TaxID=9490 RepID=A0ABQ9T9E3_SAGOE|nr:hypothetical protein P7K49_040748 [Saguinus oedipus]